MYEYLLIGAVVGAIVSYFVKEAYLERKIRRLSVENEELSAMVYTFQQKERNAKGLQVQAEKKERMNQALIEFGLAMKEPNADVKVVLQQLASKYPDIAFDIARKGLNL